MTDDTLDFDDRVESQLATISSHEDLAKFIEMLGENYESNEEFAETALSSYLDGAAIFLEGMERAYAKRGEEVPEQPDWRFVGELFYKAFVWA